MPLEKHVKTNTEAKI